MTTLALLLDVAVLATLLHAVVNALLLRRPPRNASVEERISILLPLRDEAHRVGPTLTSLLAQRGLGDVELIAYDDASSDGTADVVRNLGATRVQLIAGDEPPAGWLGKPHACARLASVATGTVLVFVDADVVLADDAVAASVELMRACGLQFVSPYPRQLAGSWLERLVQPLLCWSWLTFLPLRAAEQSRRASLAAANGQLLVVDAQAYRASGGHTAVRSEVVDDVALARVLKQCGARGGFVDGSAIARCRMYDGPRALVDGYAKSLWSAFGSPFGAIGVTALMLTLGVLPWVLVAVTGWAWPAALAGPLSRIVAAVRSGSRPVWDALVHPLSVLAFAVLVVVSLHRRRSGRLQWKGRPVA